MTTDTEEEVKSGELRESTKKTEEDLKQTIEKLMAKPATKPTLGSQPEAVQSSSGSSESDSTSSPQAEPTYKTPATSPPVTETPPVGELVRDDAVVHQGESLENAIRRQIENRPDIAKALGFEEDPTPDELREFSGGAANRLAVKEGFIAEVSQADKEAYQLRLDENGEVRINKFEVNKVGENFVKKDFVKTPSKVMPDTTPAPVVLKTTPLVKEQLSTQTLEPEIAQVDSGNTFAKNSSEQESALTKQEETEKTPELNSNGSIKPEFKDNPFGLTEEQLKKVYEIHQSNITHLPGNPMAHWKTIGKMKAHTVLNNESFANSPDFGSTFSYLEILIKVTNLKPEKRGIFNRAESVEHYIVRALQKAMEIGELEKVKVEY